jgi:hypothetical protein
MCYPGLFGGIQIAKMNDTVKKLVEISNSLKKYSVKNKKIPEAKTVLDLKSILQPLYIDKMPLVDGWDYQFHYHYEVNGEKQSYFIGSGGRDGHFDGFKQEGVYILGSNQFDEDIILSNGKLVYYSNTSYTRGIEKLNQNSNETNQ